MALPSKKNIDFNVYERQDPTTQIGVHKLLKLQKHLKEFVMKDRGEKIF